jgi:flagellar M-ring protein FliF
VGRAAELANQAKGFWTGLTPVRRVALVVLFAGVVVGALALYAFSSRVDLAPVFTNLSEEDAGAIIAKLREQRIPFQVEGHALLVPKDKVAELRLQLATDGLPKGGGVGFELFDKRTLGQSEFTQKLNYRRALMGELSRTISSLQAVERARVHLVIPERSVFVDRQQQASASVVLKLRAGRQLTQGQVQGVVHLVASAVDGLRPESVTVLDEEGRMLWRPRGEGQMGSPDLVSEEEQSIEHRVAGLVERVVGAGKVVVRVKAEVDRTQQELTVEDYDPEVRVLRSEQSTRESVGAAGGSGVTTPGGVPGVRANLGVPAGPTGTPTAASQSGVSRESAVRNYEIKRTTQRTVNPGGKIRQLWVAVLVDGRYEEKDGKRIFKAREESEIKKIEDLVKSAVGFQAERGDKVTVQSIPFEGAAAPGGSEPVVAEAPAEWTPYVTWGAVALGALLLLLLGVRPWLKGRSRAPAPEPAPALASPAVAALGSGTGETVEIPAATPREEALRLVRSDPKGAAQVIRRWIQEKGA